MPEQGPVHLRRAQADDAAGVASVHAERWHATHADLVPADYLRCVRARANVDFWRDELKVAAPDHEPWVALIDDRIVGLAAGGLTRDNDTDATTAEVYDLFVDPASWSQGIRSNLMTHLLQDFKARGFDRATYWVLASDAPTRKFVEYVGWRADGATRFEDCGGTQVEQLRYTHPIR